MKEQSSTSITVAKVFTIIDVLSIAAQDGLSLVEISKQLGMSKSTVYRYLITLESLGIAERNTSERYYLGPRIIELTGRYLAKNDLRNTSLPFMNELVRQCQETVHLAVPSGNEVVYIGKVESEQPIQMYSFIGARLPMYCTALGKAILAFSDPERIALLIKTPLMQRTKNTIASWDGLSVELARIREVGYAIDDEENEDGVRCVGAPIFDFNQKVIGAISISGPATRMTMERLEELGPLVHETASQISLRMGDARLKEK